MGISQQCAIYFVLREKCFEPFQVHFDFHYVDLCHSIELLAQT